MAKSSNPLEDANGSDVVSGLGVGGTGAARMLGAAGRGGAGRGGGCFAFFGGSAGLGLSGRAGGCEDRSGAWRFANGSQPNGSFSPDLILKLNKTTSQICVTYNISRCFSPTSRTSFRKRSKRIIFSRSWCKSIERILIRYWFFAKRCSEWITRASKGVCNKSNLVNYSNKQ